MMKIVYSEMDTPAGLSCRLEAAGHAGYAPAGQDIVCAGASTVMQGLVYLLAGEPTAMPLTNRMARVWPYRPMHPVPSGCRVHSIWQKPALCCWPSATRRMSALRM